MVASILGALILATLMAAQDGIAAARLPIIKLVATKATPELTLAAGMRWHMFLSHIWGTGQDQCATIKRQLTLLIPGVSIFLDVDDLEDIGALEEYVDATAVIADLRLQGYFKSGNCLREARCTVARGRSRWCTTRARWRSSTSSSWTNALSSCAAAVRRRDVIEWHRIRDFQLRSLTLGGAASARLPRLLSPGVAPLRA